MTVSAIFKRSLIIHGIKTSISLEAPFWDALLEIAKGQNLTRSALVSRIANDKEIGNLSSAVRLFVLNHFQERSVGLQQTSTDTVATLRPSAVPHH